MKEEGWKTENGKGGENTVAAGGVKRRRRRRKKGSALFIFQKKIAFLM
jgi:hypothetical protein